MSSTTPRIRRLPLFAKLLLPSLALIIFLGAFGAFLVVRDLSSRAQAALEQDLARWSLDGRSLLRDRELSLIESANFAANLKGVSEAVRRRDPADVAQLLQSVLALKSDLGLVVVTDAKGAGLAEFTRDRTARDPRLRKGASWAKYEFVRRTLRDTMGRKAAGFLSLEGRTVFTIAAPICAEARGCLAVGAAIVGLRAEELVESALGDHHAEVDRGVAIYDEGRRLLARAGLAGAVARAPAVPSTGPLRRTRMIDGQSISTLYSPLVLGDELVGTLAVSVPTDPAFASVQGARARLAALLAAALVGAVMLGAVITRLILRQVRPLVETNRALERGDLSARVPVLSNDELGELARGVNQMAEQLQAIYQTLELRVAERTEEVRRLLTERTEFFASISHELRTPLAIIRGRATMLTDPTYPKSSKSTIEAGKAIRATTDQLLAVVNDILELAKAESGKLEINVEQTDLRSIVKGLRPTIVSLAKAGGLRATVEIPRNLPPVHADPGRVREVLVNLVDNAVKYTEPGGELALSASTNNGSVEVSVSDTGIGIPTEVGELIFEPFYRVEGVEGQRGEASTGLGLAIVRRLVEAQGGKIWFSDGPDGGTTFTFTLTAAK